MVSKTLKFSHTLVLVLWSLFVLNPTAVCQDGYNVSPGFKCDVTDLGAKGDSNFDSQDAIQAAIDGCSEKGGGQVWFPPGHYMAPEIHMRSNVMLIFGPECRLDGTIHFEDVSNAGIEGNGNHRVHLGRVTHSNARKLLFKNIESQAGWVMRNCSNVEIGNIKLEQEMRRQANGVALTLVNCRDIFVSGCELTCNDDAFCLKRSGEHIHITSSLICGRQAASFKIGTETDGIFRNISMTNCIIYNSNRAGINIEAVDGAHIDGVRISGITMYNVAAPIFIRLGNRDRYAKGMGSIRNIEISDVHFVGMQHDEGIGSSIQGVPGFPVENVTIRNVNIVTCGGGTKEQAERAVPERAEFYPEYDIFGVLPAYGFYCRYVRGIRFTDVTLSYSEPDLRPAIFCEEVEGLEIDALDAQHWIPKNQYTEPFSESYATILLKQVRDAFIHHVTAPITAPLVDIQGDKTGGIALVDNDIRFSQVIPYSIAPEVNGWLTVTPRAEVDVDRIEIPGVKADASSEVHAYVINKGPSGFFHLDLMVGNALTDRKWEWIKAGEKKVVSLELPPLYEDRDFRLAIGEKTQTVHPEPVPGRIEYTGLETPSIAGAGIPVTVKVSVRNTGSYTKEDEVTLYRDSELVATGSISLPPAKDTILEFQVSISDPGIHEIAVGDLKKPISINPIWFDKNRNHELDQEESSFLTFNQALLLAQPGEVILVNPGYFAVDSSDLPIRIDKPGITIRSAAGYEKTVIEAVDANEECFEQHALFSVAADGITIDGFTLKTAVYNVYVENARGIDIQNNFFNVSRRYHIYMTGASDVSITGNRSRVGRYNFLTMVNSSGCLVNNNYHFEDPCGYMVTNSHNNKFIGNHFDALSWYGITLNNSNDCLVEDNLFDSGRILGLQCRRECTGNRIVKNTFINNRTEGVLITDNSRENVVTMNNILGNRGLAVTNETDYPLNALKNWWGTPDGPGGAGPGKGDSVDRNVQYEPWLKSPVKNSW